MQKCNIYKLKEGKALVEFQEKFSKYVFVEDFTKNPLEKDSEFQAIFRYVDKDTLELTDQILNCYVLPCSTFEKYFDLYMTHDEIKKRL